MEVTTIPMTASTVLRGIKDLAALRGNQREQLLSPAGNHRNLEQDENTSFLVLLTVIVAFVVLFYAICTFQICRHWIFHSCCGGRFATSRFAGRTRQNDGTILVHDGQVLTLSGDQRRAVLEVIFAGPETTKAVEEVEVANKRKHKRDRRRRNDDDIHQKNSANGCLDRRNSNEQGDDADSSIRDDDLPENVEIPTIFTDQTARSEDASPPHSTTNETDLDETEAACADEDTSDLDDSIHAQQQSEKEQFYHTAPPSGDVAELDTINHPSDNVKDTNESDCCSREYCLDDEEDDIIIQLLDESAISKSSPSPTMCITTSPVNGSVHSPGSVASSPGDFEEGALQHIVMTPIRVAELEICHSESQTNSNIGKNSDNNSVAAYSPSPDNVGTPTANEFDTPITANIDSEDRSNYFPVNPMLATETLETQRTTDSNDTASMAIEGNGPTTCNAETEGPTLSVPADDSLDLPLFQPLAMRRKRSFPIPEDMSIDENAESTDEESKMEIESIGDELTDDTASIESSQALSLDTPVPLVRRDSFTTVTSFSTLISEYTDGDSTDGNVCPICLNGYHKGEMLIVSKHCTHMFHKDCIFEWLEKHDECPICRSTMMTDSEVSKAATTLVGKTRMYRAVTTSLPQRLQQQQQQQQQQSHHLGSVRHQNPHLSSRNANATQQHDDLGNASTLLLPARPRPQHSHHLSPFQHHNHHHVPTLRNANQQRRRLGRESPISLVPPSLTPSPASRDATAAHPTTVGRAAAAAATAAADSSRRAATTTSASLRRISSAGEIRDP